MLRTSDSKLRQNTLPSSQKGAKYKRDGICFSNLFWLPPPPPKRPETRSKHYHEAEQFEFPKTKMDAEIRELWDMGSIEGYWAKLHAHNAKLRARAKAGQKPCNLYEGLGHREVAGRATKCELCNGSGVQPNAKWPVPNQRQLTRRLTINAA